MAIFFSSYATEISMQNEEIRENIKTSAIAYLPLDEIENTGIIFNGLTGADDILLTGEKGLLIQRLPGAYLIEKEPVIINYADIVLEIVFYEPNNNRVWINVLVK